MIRRFEGQFRGFDQLELFYQTWSPDAPRGSIILTHGLAEHSDCYNVLAKILADDGWQVFAWDLRGHGRSEGKRGFAMSINDYVQDLACFLRRLNLHQTNHLMFGHSMGGLISLRFLQTQAHKCQALALSSPALGLSVPVPRFKAKLAEIAMKWAPTLTLFNEIQYRDLSHDEAMLQSYAKDTLRHDKISPGVFLSMVQAFVEVRAQMDQLTLPISFQMAGEDKIVSTSATLEFIEQLKAQNKRITSQVYPDSYHEIFNDRERDLAIQDLKNFVNPYLSAVEAQ